MCRCLVDQNVDEVAAAGVMVNKFCGGLIWEREDGIFCQFPIIHISMLLSISTRLTIGRMPAERPSPDDQ